MKKILLGGILIIMFFFSNIVKAEYEKTFYDLHAQVIQHELDHMNGKLCIDYDKN